MNSPRLDPHVERLTSDLDRADAQAPDLAVEHHGQRGSALEVVALGLLSVDLLLEASQNRGRPQQFPLGATASRHPRRRGLFLPGMVDVDSHLTIPGEGIEEELDLADTHAEVEHRRPDRLLQGLVDLVEHFLDRARRVVAGPAITVETRSEYCP